MVAIETIIEALDIHGVILVLVMRLLLDYACEARIAAKADIRCTILQLSQAKDRGLEICRVERRIDRLLLKLVEGFLDRDESRLQVQVLFDQILTRLQVALSFSLFALGYLNSMVELSLHIVQGLLKLDQMLLHRLELRVLDSQLIVAKADDLAEPFSFLFSLDDFAFQ
jgi:hypothetical protein